MKSERIRVLLADDDKDDRMDFKEAFDAIKIATIVETVTDGDELMNSLNDPSKKIPHLLFLDLNMPKKSGLECLVEIKKIERLKDVTIVIYSTSSSEENVNDTFIKGANIYVKKPTDFGMLKKTLLHILSVSWQYHTSGFNRDNFLLRL